MRVLIAPDKFKGSLTAAEAAEALAAGLRRAAPDVEVDCCPVADGGEGTVDAAVAAGFGRVAVTVRGPTGAPVRAAFALRDGTAVIELAQASGLHLLPAGRPAPLTASSRGTGELVAAALDAGAGTIVLGIGGSAGTDGGAGLVAALGARLLDRRGHDLPDGGGALSEIDRLELGDLDPRLGDVTVVVASDVTNPLLGPRGAAAVYGPQKGAARPDVVALEAALTRWAEVVAAATGEDLAGSPGAGAAGGVGFAALAILGGTLRPGIDLVLDLLRFDERLALAQLVVTGEGSLDAQTLHGKGPAGVAGAAARAGRPVVAVAGRLQVADEELAGAGFGGAYALSDLEPDLVRCMTDAGSLLARVAATRLVPEWVSPGRPRARPEGPTPGVRRRSPWPPRTKDVDNVVVPTSAGPTAPQTQEGDGSVATGLRVVLAEDDVLLREGLASLLDRSGLQVVGQAGDARELLSLVRDTRPDVALIDIRMPPTRTTEGLQAAQVIREEQPDVAIMVLSAHVEVEHAMGLLASGRGVGYLLKSRVTDVGDFLETVDRVARGGSVVDPALVAELVGARRRSDPLSALSAREREVLSLMAEGRSNAGIARRLWVTEGTVEKHVRSILAKLTLPEAEDDHRRVLAVLTFLEAR